MEEELVYLLELDGTKWKRHWFTYMYWNWNCLTYWKQDVDGAEVLLCDYIFHNRNNATEKWVMDIANDCAETRCYVFEAL